jgi:hypothetical protein
MGVAGRRLYLRVPEQLADHRQPLTGGDGSGRKRVAQGKRGSDRTLWPVTAWG